MFVAKYRNFLFDFRGIIVMEKLNKLKNAMKKGVKVGVLGTALMAGTATFTGCQNPSGPQILGTGIPTLGYPGNDSYGTPCDKTLGNGNYVLHNFIGEESNVLRANQIAKDVNYYLGNGETYVMGLVDKFNESLQDRPTAQAYFNNFISAEKSNNFQRLNENGTNPYSFDRTINGIGVPCEPIFEDIIRNIDNNRERHLFIRCYETIANESFKYGLGAGRYGSNVQVDGYNETREDIYDAWTTGVINNPFDLNNDIDNQNCRQVTNEIDTLLTQVANNMNNGISANDLRQVINISTTANSLTAMHSRSASALEHTGASCGLNIATVSRMRNVAREMYQAEQQQAQGLGL